ncbi:MAG: M48 family metallopeptidase [Gemmataceae bacterium]|nr:M48 family metallopeptidase [Gemmataceae bacterium]
MSNHHAPAAEPLRRTPGLKAVIGAGVLVYVVLFFVTTFTQSAAAEARAAAYFSRHDIERGLRYAFERRLFFWSSTAVQLLFLGAVVFSGFGRRLADFCDRLVPVPRPAGGQTQRLRHRLFDWLHRLAVVVLVGAFCFLAVELLVLPLRLGRLANDRAWGMTNRDVLSWLRDYGVALAVTGGLGAIALAGLYALIRLFPRRWWLLGALGSVALGILYAFILPVWINPLFNTFTPLKDPYLRASVRTLADRAGVPVQEVLVMDASRHGRHTNAYFTGFGSTRRIVLYDTLPSLRPLPPYSPAEAASVVGLLAAAELPAVMRPAVVGRVLGYRSATIDEDESILAHEIGHWQHNHIVKGILLAGLGGFVGLYLVARLLTWAVGRAPFGLRSPADPAGVPLLLLLSLVGAWVAWPVENAVSRHFESQADMAALKLASRPEAFIEAEKRLARDNLSNVAPTPFAVWLFASHPPTVERIRMAEEWRRKREAGR